MEERTILLTIKYDGTNYHGWQVQPDLPTIQGEVEKGLSTIFKREMHIDGTGRTDRGVHAYGQCATFTCEKGGIPTERIAFALTNLLPPDIEIVSAEEKPEGFHARFSAMGKTYSYMISTGDESMFLQNYCYQLKDELDVEAMRKGASFMEGTHDFKCFQATGSDEKETTVRTIYKIEIEEKKKPGNGPAFFDDEGESSLIRVNVTGDGFLYNMVRIIAGTLVEIGQGKKNPEDVKAIIDSMDRQNAGHTAPPWGLYLKEVYFEEVANG